MIYGEELLPLVFRTPPGWPEPDIHWRRSHQGWAVPAGWTPRAGVREAPADWRFWARNAPVWQALVRRKRRRPMVRLAVGIAAFVSCITLMTLGFAVENVDAESAQTPLMIMMSIAIVGLYQILRGVSLLTDAPDGVLRDIRAAAPEAKRIVETELYASYLSGWR